MSLLTPWGPLGFITFARTYARRLKEDDLSSTTESFEQSVDRVIKACRKQLKVGFTEEEEIEVRSMLLGLKFSVAGRFWWQLGTKTVDKLGLFSLQNCAFVVVNQPVEPFCWTFDALMLGSGVGYNIQKEFVYELPKPKKAKIVRQDTKDADFIVPDSREGWVQLLRKTLESHFVSGKGFSYSTICVRGKGAPIKSFGGVASGPEELCYGINEISKILNNRAGKKVRPIDCLDIMNIIGYVVVSGNVRRSAQIAIGDCDDIQFLRAKRWDLGDIPNWRAMSNNSVVCNDFAMLPEEFWEGYNGNGEPYGLINLKLSQSVGRLEETEYPDYDVQGVNPCGEQSLESWETCCLGELFLPNLNSKEEFFSALKMAYRICKHSLTLPCHQEQTEKIVHKNMRMGLGITGQLQATKEQNSWLSDGYEMIRKYDKEYSKAHGFNPSIKLTTIKPSGTLSLLAGVTPGCHPGFSQYFIRRIRIASNSSLIKVCKDNGYNIEYQRNFDGSEDKNTMVVEFPCSYPLGTILAKDMSAIQQLENIEWLQKNWSDNSVSCTVYYKKEELQTVREWMAKKYNTSLKACSFLLHSEHGFIQAPFEEISKDVYDQMVSVTKPINGIEIKESDFELDECVSGHCPIK